MGCVRKTKLFCRSNTSQSVPSRGKQDGFLKMPSVNLPDFHDYISNLGAEECKDKCLGNCSCLDYTHINNIGCLVWSKDLIDIQEFASGGNDLFICLAHAELGERKQIKLMVSLIAVCFYQYLGWHSV